MDAVLAAAPVAVADRFAGLNVVVIPHILAVAFMDATTHPAAHWCSVAIRTILNMDLEINAKDPSNQKTAANDEDDVDDNEPNPGDGPAAKALGHIPQILWAMAKQAEMISLVGETGADQAQCIEVTLMEPLNDGPGVQWGEAIHEIELAGIHSTNSASNGSSGGGGGAQGLTAEQLGEAFAKGLAANSSNNTTKKQGHKKWTDCHTRMVLNATEKTPANFVHPETGKSYANQVALQPTVHHMAICAASSLATASQVATTLFKHTLKCDFIPPHATITAIREGAGFLWERQDTPGPYSTLSFAPIRFELQGQDQGAIMAIRLAEQSGRGFTDAQIRLICSLCHAAPHSPDTFGRFLHNKDCVNQALWGARSYLRKKCTEEWIIHFKANGEAYEALGHDDSQFWAKRVFIIDRGEQTHLQSCLTANTSADINTRCLDNFTNIQDQIVYRTFVGPSLPIAVARMVETSRYAALPPPPPPPPGSPPAYFQQQQQAPANNRRRQNNDIAQERNQRQRTGTENDENKKQLQIFKSLNRANYQLLMRQVTSFPTQDGHKLCCRYQSEETVHPRHATLRKKAVIVL